MPLPWLIGAAVVAAVAVVAKAVSDDSSSSSYDDSDSDRERRRQEQAAKRQRDREGLQARIQALAGEQREQLKAQLRVAASALVSPSDEHENVVQGLSKMTTLTLEGFTADQLEQQIRSTTSSTSSYGRTVKAILQASSAVKERQISQFMQGVNLLETVTAPVNAAASNQAVLAQVQSAQARIERLQELKRQLLTQA